MKVTIATLRYEHPDHGSFVVSVLSSKLCVVSRHYGDYPRMHSERFADVQNRREARKAIRARIAELDAAAANHNPEPLCSGKGQVSCA